MCKSKMVSSPHGTARSSELLGPCSDRPRVPAITGKTTHGQETEHEWVEQEGNGGREEGRSGPGRGRVWVTVSPENPTWPDLFSQVHMELHQQYCCPWGQQGLPHHTAWLAALLGLAMVGN